jgi:type IV pilus assembly protein PilX
MRTNMPIRVPSRQAGAVLAIALIFLVVLTLLAVTGAQNTILEERMSGNFRDQQIAIEAAEAAMRKAEDKLATIAVFDAMAWDGSDATYDGTPSQDPFGSITSENVSVPGIDGVASHNPTYYIEKLPLVAMPESTLVVGYEAPPTIRYYRTTTKGWGQSDTTDPQVVLQSTFFNAQ